MTGEVLSLLARLNIVASAAIVLVLLLRGAVRRRFGAQAAYGLWLTVPLAMAGALNPLAQTDGPVGPLETAKDVAEAWLAADGRGRAMAVVWALGLAASAGLVAWRYLRFLAQARAGRAGPAIVGVLTPRMVAPADFSTRFTPDERRLVTAHERAHMDRLDARWNALTLVLQCLNWFNPLVHVAAGAMRFDQELACDATVMTRLPTERRRYAETLLRSREAIIASPLGCGWRDNRSSHFALRLTTLLQQRPADRRGHSGSWLVAVLWITAFAAAWAAQPPYHLPQRSILFMDLTPPTQAPPAAITLLDTELVI